MKYPRLFLQQIKDIWIPGSKTTSEWAMGPPEQRSLHQSRDSPGTINTSSLPSQISPTTPMFTENCNISFRVKMSQFTIHNDMSLFHQQKWCLDKIQLTLAIQMNEKGRVFFFFSIFVFFCTILYLQWVNDVLNSLVHSNAFFQKGKNS